MKENLFDIKDKVVVMTGACGVLGGTIVKYFASQGAKVVLLDLERASSIGEALVKEIAAEGGEAMFLATNVLDKQVLEENYREVMARFGKVDVLLNAAGGNMASATVPPDKTIFDLDVDAVKRVTELNLFGTIIPTMVFARAMAESGRGSIINFASESALRPLTRVAGYGVAKAAVANWTKYLCAELAIKFGEGIRVNAIAPGFLLTNQNRALLTNEDGSLTDRSHTILAHTPFGRFLEPDELPLFQSLDCILRSAVQAGLQLSVSRQANTVAGSAEMVAQGTDQADVPHGSRETVQPRYTAVLFLSSCIRKLLQDSLTGNEGCFPKFISFLNRHQLNKAHIHWITFRQLGQRNDLIVIESADQNRIDFYFLKSCIQCRVQAIHCLLQRPQTCDMGIFLRI